MPKRTKLLTVKEINALPDGRSAVGGVTGLYVEKNEGRIKNWRLRYRKKDSKEQVVTYPPHISLSEARERARRDIELFNSGSSPQEERQKAIEQKKLKAQEREKEKKAQITVDFCAREFFSGPLNSGAESTKKRRRQTYDIILAPLFGDMAVAEITPRIAADKLMEVLTRSFDSGKKAYTLLRQIINFAIAREMVPIEVNPIDTRGAFGALIKPYSDNKAEHHPSLPYEQIQGFIKELMKKYSSASAQALLFLILTASRTSEVLLAEWKEIDLDKGLWTIPEEHLKTKDKGYRRNRTKPLSPQVVRWLKSIPQVGPLIFVKRQNLGLNEPLSSFALLELLKGMHKKKMARDGGGWRDPLLIDERTGEAKRITTHGFRATFRSWAESLTSGEDYEKNQLAAERLLLHEKQDNLKGAYRRYDFMPEARKLAQKWSEYCLEGREINNF